ncbi:Hypothetical Protein SCAB [Streptomyces leeuwenhoekii]|uniref:Uncharacterized protein n=2 Tax=Streptomyces leeuwenhoekii TaxID=1437453 RepID=A0A0F7VPS3_STRLW|nr:hypothetical protein [Streptomyces leeuwenhoekii]CQR61805.1 Hypothetical Protein SCAB [Streptomyces leeuwenhoekii]
MFDRIRRRKPDALDIEMQRRHREMWQRMPRPAVPPEGMRPSEPVAEVDDFLPPDLRVPSHDQVAGRMMPWLRPLVLDGEIVTCTVCGTYRDWVIVSTRDEIWLRCRAGHEQQERRLDAAWYNRHSGPVDSTHATFEDCLRHLGH